MGPEGKPAGRLKKIHRGPCEETPGCLVAAGDFSKQGRTPRFASAHEQPGVADGIELPQACLPEARPRPVRRNACQKSFAVARNAHLACDCSAPSDREKSPGPAKCNISAPPPNRHPGSAVLEAHDHERERRDKDDDRQQQRPTRHPSLRAVRTIHDLTPLNNATPSEPNKIVGDHAATTGWIQSL